MHKKIIIGNWKMNPLTLEEAKKLFFGVVELVSRVKKIEIAICAPATYLESLSKIRTSKVKLGAQDAFYEESGAYTGEISGEMLYNIGARYVILGHSERRALGENNNDINRKIKASVSAGLAPILCVGESTRDESHSYFNFVKTQVEECLAGIKKTLISKVIVAYEPVWAISSTPNRKDASPTDSLEMAIFIRKILSDKFGSDAERVRILYGGSVNEKDALGFLENGGVDGLLAGKASLDAKKFTEIVKICEASAK